MSDRITIHNDMTVADMIGKLQELPPDQPILTQAIAPDGAAYNVPAVLHEIPFSDAGGGLRYLGLQMRCESADRKDGAE